MSEVRNVLKDELQCMSHKILCGLTFPRTCSEQTNKPLTGHFVLRINFSKMYPQMVPPPPQVNFARSNYRYSLRPFRFTDFSWFVQENYSVAAFSTCGPGPKVRATVSELTEISSRENALHWMVSCVSSSCGSSFVTSRTKIVVVAN